MTRTAPATNPAECDPESAREVAWYERALQAIEGLFHPERAAVRAELAALRTYAESTRDADVRSARRFASLLGGL